jgi:large subunit ribosomal protein L6
MSRLAKKPIPIPERVAVAVTGDALTVTGPAATLSRAVPSTVSLTVKDRTVEVTPRGETRQAKMNLGTTVAHLKNMLQGVREPFVKKLIIEGIGFKADVKGAEMTLSLGFSHPVKVAVPKDLKVTSEKGVVTVSGADIEAVGAFAARVRALKKPEPYKGKGIRYEAEVIRRKQGKKTT